MTPVVITIAVLLSGVVLAKKANWMNFGALFLCVALGLVMGANGWGPDVRRFLGWVWTSVDMASK